MRMSVAAAVGFLFVPICAATSAQDVGPPVIELVSPTEGPAAGGTIVNLYGKRFDPRIACFAPCPTRVFFDESEAELLLESDSLVAVRSPKHEPGGSVITLHRADGATTTAAFTYLGDAEDPRIPILLPILIDETPGAFGSRWVSAFWLFNGGSDPLPVAHLECDEVCPEIFPLSLIVQPGELVENPRLGFNPPGSSPGTLIWLPRLLASNAHFALRIRDLSRPSLTWGTTIPVVRDDELHAGVSQLIDVPIDEGFRSAIRIYDIEARARLDFLVRFFPAAMPPPEYLGPPILEVTISTTGDSGYLPGKPGYAQILDLRSAFSGVPLPSRARIEIEPVTPGIRYWAFASVTNDETQHVTIVVAE